MYIVPPKHEITTLTLFLRIITSLILFDIIFPNELITLIVQIYHETFLTIKISGSLRHSLCLKDGQVYGSGSNTYYTLGTSDLSDTFFFVKSDTLEDLDIVNISCGIDHSIVQTRDGKAYGFGSNINGQLGRTDIDFDQNSFTIRTKIQIRLDNVINISCGNFFSIIQTMNGLYSSGSNMNGCLGRKPNESFKRFGKIENIPDNIISFRCSLWTVFILTKENLYVHGNNHYNQLGIEACIPDKIIYYPTSTCIDNVVSYFNGHTASLILTKSHLLVCDQYNFPPCRVDIKIPIIQCITINEGKTDQIIYTTSKGVYYANIIDDGIAFEQSCCIYKKPVLSIHSCRTENGFFIETKEKLFAIGSSENGELGIGKIMVLNDHIPHAVIFHDKFF
jgi:alpha-tubulin suppressor-like RCC1 family protein